MKYGFGSLLLAALSTAMISCEDKAEFAELENAKYPEAVKLVLPDAQQALLYTEASTETTVLPLIKGEQVTLGFSIAPDDVTYQDVVWTSSNESVATVDATGKVTAVSGDGTGYTIIQVAPVAYYSGSNIGSTLKVIVANSLTKAESITLSSTADEVYAGESIQLSAAILPSDATYKTVSWTSSDEKLATVDATGKVTGVKNDAYSATVTITATALDGSGVKAEKDITVMQIVDPEDITIDQKYSADEGYLLAIADKSLTLDYTTVPAQCTKSLIEWTTSDATVATVADGVVTLNQTGVFGDVTITATCPTTGKSSSIKLHIEEGLVRELFHNQSNYTWYNSKQSGNGTSSSHEWHDGYVTVTTYKQNATKRRGDFKCWSATTWLNAGSYPIFAIRMDDLKDLDGVTGRNITLDASGTCDGASFSGGLDGNNNRWLHDYKCSDGSHVFIYDLTQQKWANGGLLPTTATAAFKTLQFKYADIVSTDELKYNVYWVQTFKTLDDVKSYIATEGLTYDVIK